LKRITKAALGGVAGCALVLGGTQLASGLSSLIVNYPSDGDLVSLGAEGEPFDDAYANLVVKVTPEATNFKVNFTDVASTAAGKVFGAHLHTNACNDASGGPHYNHEVHGVVPGKKFPHPSVPVEDWAEVSSRTEVWFQLVPNAHGDATAEATVSFLPVDPDGAMSIVVHIDPNNKKTGVAGSRQACFTVDASDWAATAPS
jgi:Cu/Zn superoxide dismutase